MIRSGFIASGIGVGGFASSSRRAGGVASYLPTLYGTAPIWHHASTTPNADGAISAMADISLGLYPLSQGTAGNQPTRGGGKVNFATDDFIASVDATLTGWASAQAAVSIWVIGECNGSTPAANETIAGFGSSASNNRYIRLVHDTSDRLLAARGKGDGTEPCNGVSAAGITATRSAYVVTFTGGASDTVTTYRDGTQIATGTGAVDSYVTNQFSLGALWRSTAAAFFNGAIVAAGVKNGVLTAGEIAQITAYKDAGAPR